ncbi:MAG: MFS transporter, partial [bacterium]|nr:MFS transporter [bacterium]
AFVGFNFGAAMVLYATQTSDVYRPENFGRIYARVSLAYGLSGTIGPFVGGLVYDLSGNYWAAVVIAAAVALSGALFYSAMGRRIHRHAPLPEPTPD